MVTISTIEIVDNYWADSEQPEIFHEDMVISKTASWQEDVEKEQASD